MDRANKIVFIKVKLIEGWKDKDIIKELCIPRRTYFYWKRLIREKGHAVLMEKQKPGPKPRFSLNPADSKRIQVWRKSYGWGPTKIEGHLDRHYNIHIPHNRIYQLLKERDLNNPMGTPRKSWGKKRWERVHSMSLWQGDWKDTNSDDRKPMMTFYDDHSRFVVASRRFEHATMENTIRLAGHAFRRHGKPEQILTDNGTQFTCTKSEKLTEFERFCLDNGVEAIRSTKNRPTTCGKIENFHGCYDNEIWVTRGDHAKFVRYWNCRRPNGAIGYLFPVEVFYRDRKSAINSG
jgi:putative transposase